MAERFPSERAPIIPEPVREPEDSTRFLQGLAEMPSDSAALPQPQYSSTSSCHDTQVQPVIW